MHKNIVGCKKIKLFSLISTPILLGGGFASLTLVNQCSCNPTKPVPEPTYTLNIQETLNRKISEVHLAIGWDIPNQLELIATDLNGNAISDPVFTWENLPSWLTVENGTVTSGHPTGNPTSIYTVVKCTSASNSELFGQTTIKFVTILPKAGDGTDWEGVTSGGDVTTNELPAYQFLYNSCTLAFSGCNIVSPNNLIIPEFVTNIFRDQLLLYQVRILDRNTTDVTFPSTIQGSVEIPGSCVFLSNNFFYGGNFKTAIFPEFSFFNITINWGCFANAHLESLVIPNYIKAISGSVFSGTTIDNTLVFDNCYNCLLYGVGSPADPYFDYGSSFNSSTPTNTISEIIFKNFSHLPDFSNVYGDDVPGAENQYMFDNINSNGGTIYLDGGSISVNDTLNVMRNTYGLPDNWTVQTF